MTTYLIKWINPGSAKFNASGKDETGEYKVNAKTHAEAKSKFNSWKVWYHKTYPNTKILSVTKVK